MIPISEIVNIEDEVCNTFSIDLNNSIEYKFAVRKNKKKLLKDLNEHFKTTRIIPDNVHKADTFLTNKTNQQKITLCNTFYGTPLIIKPLRIKGNFALSDSTFSYYPSIRKNVIKDLHITKNEIKMIRSNLFQTGIIIKLKNNFKYKFITKEYKDLIINRLSDK